LLLVENRYENEFNAVQDVFELQVCIFIHVDEVVDGWAC
jgi:hypothetical protein